MVQADSTSDRLTGRVTSEADTVFEALRARAGLYELPLSESEGRADLSIWGLSAQFRRDGNATCIEVVGGDERLRQTFQDMTSEFLEERGLVVAWDRVAEGALAPGLSLMTVIAVEEQTPGFMRVRLRGPEAYRFGRGGLHFRLLLPPQGREPQWPRISKTGRTVWPEGEDALHRPVYTTIAQEDDWLDFDIYRHADSPTCQWAERGPVGETVGIVGPGGGWCPNGEPLLLFGDETAVPAVARMLQIASGEVRAFLKAVPEDLAAIGGDSRVIAVSDLLASLRQTQVPDGAHVWFAGPRPDVQAARSHLLDQGISKKDFTAVAYWG